jgi:hypothetical protein
MDGMESKHSGNSLTRIIGAPSDACVTLAIGEKPPMAQMRDAQMVKIGLNRAGRHSLEAHV